jgi:hypothetical protein
MSLQILISYLAILEREPRADAYAFGRGAHLTCRDKFFREYYSFVRHARWTTPSESVVRHSAPTEHLLLAPTFPPKPLHSPDVRADGDILTGFAGLMVV